MMHDEDGQTLVVMERGAEWPGLVFAPGGCTPTAMTLEPRWMPPNTQVVAQDEHEHPALLVRRTLARLDRLASTGQPLHAAVVAVADGGEGSAQAARADLANALIDRLRDQREERALWLTAPSTASPALRHQLVALAGALTTRLAGSQVTVGIRFGGAGPAEPRVTRSGFRARVVPLAV